MRLCEEYLHRHGIEVETVPHVECGSVLFKKHDSPLWNVFYVEWIPPDFRPGHYLAIELKPTPEGYDLWKRDQHYGDAEYGPLTIVDSQLVDWSDYEEFISSWIEKTTCSEIAVSSQELEFAAWEMLVLCCDKVVSERGFHHKLYGTVDENMLPCERSEAMKEFLDFCKDNFADMHSLWQYEMRRYYANCWNWLVDKKAVCKDSHAV